MDLFNAKALAAAESRCAALEREITQLTGDRNMLATNLRNMDDKIFAMSSLQSYDSMRPLIGDLVRMMEARRQRESDRINSIIHSELNRSIR